MHKNNIKYICLRNNIPGPGITYLHMCVHVLWEGTKNFDILIKNVITMIKYKKSNFSIKPVFKLI